MARYVTLDETIKLMKADLRREFPGVKFSIRRSRGTGYGSVYVNWTDGPKMADVDAIANHYAGAEFDGMTDTSYSVETIDVGADGTPEAIRYGTKYVLTSRELTDAYMAKYLRKVIRSWGCAKLSHDRRAELLALDDSALVRESRNVVIDGEYAHTLAYRIEADAHGFYANMFGGD